MNKISIKGEMEMKEITELNTVYLQEYNVNVNRYLTYAQIQQIVDGVMELKRSGADDWATRQTNIDVCILFHTTDMKAEEIEKYGHSALLQSGLISSVCENIINLNQVYDAIAFTESTGRAIGQVLKEISKNLNTNDIKDLIKQAKKTK